MLNETPFKSGYVAVLGCPNVGKSTLINALLKQKVAAVSPRPQTTRRRQLGILTQPDVQIVFVDTPGVHRPHHRLGKRMNETARDALLDCDLILFLVDASQPPSDEDRLLAGLIVETNRSSATLLVLNKVDLLDSAGLAERQAAFGELLSPAMVLPISALTHANLDALMAAMLARLPEGPPYYPEEQVTDLYEREITADLVREAALIHLRDEIPHGIVVRIDEYKDRDEHGQQGAAYIAATLFVERESHKPIIIGQGGSMLKKIGSAARQQIESLTGRKVFLELRVKVQSGWRDDDNLLRRFGFGKGEKGK
jgi:GTPase